MQEADADIMTHSPDQPGSTLSGSIEAPRWPNTAVVLEALAALEEEFKAVLNRPAGP